MTDLGKILRLDDIQLKVRKVKSNFTHLKIYEAFVQGIVVFSKTLLVNGVVRCKVQLGPHSRQT